MTFNTVTDAYLHALADVLYSPEHTDVAPRNLPIFEKEDYQFTVRFPTAEPVTTRNPVRNEIIKSYTAKEMALYDSGSNSANDFAAISKFWNKLRNPDGTVNSAYGRLIFFDKTCGNPNYELPHYEPGRMDSEGLKVMRTPWNWAKQTLIKDRDSRQAILKFHRHDHLWVGNKDQTCTMHGMFRIRANKLNFSIVMRSNDLVKGTVYDVPWFVSLMDKMAGELQETYPGLSKGSYRHYAHSLHIYRTDLEIVAEMLGSKTLANL